MFLQGVREFWCFQVQTQSCEHLRKSRGIFSCFTPTPQKMLKRSHRPMPHSLLSISNASASDCALNHLKVVRLPKMGSCEVVWVGHSARRTRILQSVRYGEGQGDLRQEDLKEASEDPSETTSETRYHMDVTTVDRLTPSVRI